MAKALDYRSITLEFRTPGKEVEVKFSDLQETLKGIRWGKVSGVVVTNIPCHRGDNPDDFQDAVTRYVFNKQELWELRKATTEFEKIIFGE